MKEGHNNSAVISHFHFLHNTSVFVRRKSIRSNGCRLLLLCPSLLSLYIQTGKMQRRPHHKKGVDSTEEQLDLRTKVHSKRYLCEQCGKMFKTLLSLKVHQRLHTGQKPYSCDQCGQSFAQLVHLQVHQFGHSGKNHSSVKSVERPSLTEVL